MKRLVNRWSTRVREPGLGSVRASHAQLFAAMSRRLCLGINGSATLTVQQQWWLGEAQLATTNPPGEQFSEFYKRGAGFSGDNSGAGNAAQQAEFDAMVRADIP